MSYVKSHGFHGNAYCASKEWGCPYKSTHISAATQPKRLKLVPTQCKDIGLSSNVHTCKLSNLHIHEY